MAWDWGHTSEAYENARQNLTLLPAQDLVEAWAEFQTDEYQADYDSQEHELNLAHGSAILRDEGRDTLEAAVWRLAERQATCDNGGHNAWICPEGCHTVSFSPEED